jgi:thiamine biosynthesis lipoprotein
MVKKQRSPPKKSQEHLVPEHPVEMRKHKISLLCLACVLFLSACTRSSRWHSSSFLFFDTLCELTLFCNPQEFKNAKNIISSVFGEIEARFAPHKKTGSGPESAALFRRAYEVYLHSQGYFDISVSPLSELWGFRDKFYRIPSEEEILRILPAVGMEKIIVKEDQVLLPPGMALDWGGIAKGFGIDKAARSIIELGYSRGFINAGGDLFCWGRNPDDQNWRIGIKHPRRGGFIGIISISGLAAATTGDYQRFFIRNDTRYHHVFDPKTGYPARGKQSVTVVGPETLLCDALATALFVHPCPESVLDHYTDYGAFIIMENGLLKTVGKEIPFTKR